MTGEKKPPMRTVGECPCPLCKHEIPFKEQKSGLASVSCSWCGFQAFARTEESDRGMRKWMTKRNAPPAPAPNPDPPPPKKKAKEPAPEPAAPERSFLDI